MNGDFSAVIDRFEGKFAVLVSDGGEVFEILREDLPAGVAEGVTVRKKDGAYTLDLEDAAKRSERIKKKMDSLFE